MESTAAVDSKMLMIKLEFRLEQAQFRRQLLLLNRKRRLQIYLSKVSHQVTLARCQQKLQCLKQRTVIEFKQQRAFANRELQKATLIQKHASGVSHAFSVALVQKFMKLTQLTEPEMPSLEMIKTMSEADYRRHVTPFLPGINRFTLRDLDTREILASPQLRHDLVFDPGMYFKPIDSGAMGERRKQRLEDYWIQLEQELNHSYARVPLLLFEVKNILEEILPGDATGKELLNSHFSAITQDLNDFEPFTFLKGLSDKILSKNCAPARDELVQDMLLAAKDQNFHQSLKLLFSLLECMKLDFANHQLKTLRPYVMGNAVDYERRWFVETYGNEWPLLKQMTQHVCKEQKPTCSKALFSMILIELIKSGDTCTERPESFRLDGMRLFNFHGDIHDICVLSSVMLSVYQLTKMNEHSLMELKENVWTLFVENATDEDIIIYLMDKIKTTLSHDAVESMLKKSIMRYNPIHTILEKRIYGLIHEWVHSSSNVEENWEKYGLQFCKSEINLLKSKIQHFVKHHWNVYSPLYNQLFLNIG